MGGAAGVAIILRIQVHRGQAARIQTTVKQALLLERPGHRKRALELYAGSGSLGLSLAKAGAEVTLVESFAPAAQAARERMICVSHGLAGIH